MTPQDHNKVIGIMHLVYGGMNALMLPLILIFVLMGAGLTSLDPSAPPEAGLLFLFIGLAMGFYFLIFGLPQLIAGYGMLRRRRWARTWGIIASILSAISFPLGTALCVYTLWFLFGEGQDFHEESPSREHWRGTLPEVSTFGWDARAGADGKRPFEYTPPPQPPNWRDET